MNDKSEFRRKVLNPCIAAMAVLLFIAPFANAQLLELNNPDGTNVVLSTSESYARVIVGRDQPSNHLNITGGGLVEVGSLVEIGQQAGATNSMLSVSGGGLMVIGNAATNNLPASGIVVGDSSGSGELKVGFGSTVETDNLYVGAGTNETGHVSAKNGGEIMVTDSLVIGTSDNSNNQVSIENGSSLQISETSNLQINNKAGATEDLNSLNIKSGGSLMVLGDVDASDLSSDKGVSFESGAKLGVGGVLSANDNSINNGLNILLDDALSTNHTAVWNADYMDIGISTSGNSLTVRSGATVTSTNAVNIGTDDTASGNTLTVEGSNSTFTALGTVYVGVNGSQNKMNIKEGASATISGQLKIGSSSSSGNEMLVSGEGSSLLVNNDVYIGNYGNNSTLNIKDGASADFQNNLYLGSRSANNYYFQTDSTNTVAGEFIIGETEDASGDTGSPNPEIEVTSGNIALVGENSTLNIQQNLTVGKEGSGSILSIRDGGTVNVAGDAIIGEAVGDNYIYLRRDSNTQFNVTGDLIVGKEGGSNRFADYGGTADIGGSLYLGASTNQHVNKNFIHLETTNAILNVANAVYIGASNSINTLDIVKGATLTAQDLFVGEYEGTSNNVVTVTGDGSVLSVSNKLEIGSATGTGNSVTIKSGGILNVAQTDIMISGTNNTLTIAQGGTLKTDDWDYSLLTGSATNILIEGGTTLHLLGMLSGTNMVENEMSVILDGPAAGWNTDTNNLYVGSDGDNNSLTITNGAMASTLTNLYIGSASRDNAVTVGGAGSSLNIGEDLYVGTESYDSAYNTLAVLDGANVTIDNDAFLYRRATLKIGSSSQVTVGGDYVQDSFSTLEIGISSNQVSPNLIVGGNAGFSSSDDSDQYPLIRILNEGIGESNIITIVQADTITLDGADATGISIESNIASNALLGFTISVTNDVNHTYIVLDDFILRTWKDAAGLEGMLANVADEIQNMANLSNEFAQAMDTAFQGMTAQQINKAMNDYYGDKMSSSPAHNAINMGLQSVAEQLTKRADNTRARMGMASAKAPEGTAGPHMDDQPMQGWIAGYKTWADKSADSGFNGYDGNIGGFIVGADLSVAEGILVGIAGGAGSSTLDSDNGASTDTDTTFGSIYMSAGTKDWFADASLIYGGSSADTVPGKAFDTTGSFDAQNTAIYFGGGKEIIGDYMIITPQASMLANYYKQDGYEEKSSNAVGRRVDSFDALYLQSSVGCNVGFYTALGSLTLKPEFRAFWLHEFNAQDESLSYTLIGGTNPYTMVLQAPEEDIIKIGAGLSAKIGEYLELRADLDLRRGADYSDHTLLGSLRYQF